MAIDLRSDTVTKPSQAMRDAIASAPVGDDVYADDPTVNSLEERVAALFGKEAALFSPTGSLANQLAIRSLVGPGEELIAETNAVENTHNFGGGTVQPITEIAALKKGADEIGVALHLDGARIWNAHVASGVAFSEYGKYFDTISVCLSKGLGAPVGSLVLGSKEMIARTRVWRKRYGGGMRQIGILAAAGHFALDHNINRLTEDHARAKKIAVALATIDSSLIDPATVETNIVGLDLANFTFSAADFAAACKEKGLWISALGPKYARLVTHLDFDDAQTDEAIEILKSCLKT
ncbi:MAG: low specificity L-threonine aldolase [Actinobacteria bacterium]|nr:low specificity L-threonine aldolase [Actinomycetota bacterium]